MRTIREASTAFFLSVGLTAFLVTVAGADDSDPTGTQSDRTVVDVDRSIRIFLAESPCVGLAANAEARREMAEKIAAAATANEIPPVLLSLMAYRESTFDRRAVGSRGEIGILQVHGLAAKGCELGTVEGQLDCGAKWLRAAYENCGSWDKAIIDYASGRCNADENGRLFRAAHSRFAQWRRARQAVDSCGSDREHWACKPQPEKCLDAVRVQH